MVAAWDVVWRIVIYSLPVAVGILKHLHPHCKLPEIMKW